MISIYLTSTFSCNTICTCSGLIKVSLCLGPNVGSLLTLSHGLHLQVTGIILRGIFLLRKKEIDWFYQGGASAIYPDGKCYLTPKYKVTLILYHNYLKHTDVSARTTTLARFLVYLNPLLVFSKVFKYVVGQ